MEVVSVNSGSSAGETVGQQFMRCYNIKDAMNAFDNNDKLIDNTSGGSFNTYSFKCSEPAENVISATKIHINIAVFISTLVIAFSSLI